MGMVKEEENEGIERFIEKEEDVMEENIEMDEIKKIWIRKKRYEEMENVESMKKIGKRIEVEREDEFDFEYMNIFEGWRRRGEEIYLF